MVIWTQVVEMPDILKTFLSAVKTTSSSGPPRPLYNQVCLQTTIESQLKQQQIYRKDTIFSYFLTLSNTFPPDNLYPEKTFLTFFEDQHL